MSLFETFKTMSDQHVKAVESGVYTFENPPATVTRTVSLYNLLDHSRNDLDILHGIIRHYFRLHIEPVKESVPSHYTAAIAWMRILETAIKERERRDSEAWAEKTAKEIKEQTL